MVFAMSGPALGVSIIYCDVFESAIDILKTHQLHGIQLWAQFIRELA